MNGKTAAVSANTGAVTKINKETTSRIERIKIQFSVLSGHATGLGGVRYICLARSSSAPLQVFRRLIHKLHKRQFRHQGRDDTE